MSLYLFRWVMSATNAMSILTSEGNCKDMCVRNTQRRCYNAGFATIWYPRVVDIDLKGMSKPVIETSWLWQRTLIGEKEVSPDSQK